MLIIPFACTSVIYYQSKCILSSAIQALRLNNRLHRFTRCTSISGSSSMMVQVCSPRSS